MPAPLNILHLTLASDAGGLSRYVIDLAAAMRAAGHTVTVAGDCGAWQWAFDEARIPYVQIPLKNGLRGLRKSNSILRDWMRENKVDVIHTHYRRATILGRRLQTRRRVPPIVYTLHLSHISLKFPRRHLTDFGDRTIAASADAQQWLIDDARVPADRIAVIPHGIDLAKYSLTTAEQRRDARAKLNLSECDLVALFVGRLDYPKNEEWMLDLAAATRESMPNLRVLLVGEGPHESMLRERIARENLGQRVQLLGHRETLPIYRAADAILLPSIREGFSYVCAEAMATGVPALRTRTSGTRELIVENITGRSTQINRDAFLSAAPEFLRHRESLRRMGISAADHVRTRFDFRRQLDRTLDLYRSMVTLGH